MSEARLPERQGSSKTATSSDFQLTANDINFDVGTELTSWYTQPFLRLPNPNTGKEERFVLYSPNNQRVERASLPGKDLETKKQNLASDYVFRTVATTTSSGAKEYKVVCEPKNKPLQPHDYAASVRPMYSSCLLTCPRDSLTPLRVRFLAVQRLVLRPPLFCCNLNQQEQSRLIT